ncbi:MAG: alkaline phosphatase family protein [Rhodobacteraceae bacterium]|nr:alkaline phosphatase family protein [Paracoccaceae bacterium]
MATGVPLAVHGISGNTFLDRESGEEVMMNDVSFLRAETVFGAFQRSGDRVAVVTAKDKLRTLLGEGLDCGAGDAACFSAERSADTTFETNGLAAAGRPGSGA